MRLKAIRRGRGVRQKLALAMIRVLSGRRAPDVVRTLMFRSDFLGQNLRQWTQAVMRGRSEWTIGERELFAAFTSRLNQCVF